MLLIVQVVRVRCLKCWLFGRSVVGGNRKYVGVWWCYYSDWRCWVGVRVYFVDLRLVVLLDVLYQVYEWFIGGILVSWCFEWVAECSLFRFGVKWLGLREFFSPVVNAMEICLGLVGVFWFSRCEVVLWLLQPSFCVDAWAVVVVDFLLQSSFYCLCSMWTS